MGDNKPEQTNIKDVGEDNYNKDMIFFANEEFYLATKNKIWYKLIVGQLTLSLICIFLDYSNKKDVDRTS